MLPRNVRERETESLGTQRAKPVWPFSPLGSVPPLSGRPGALGSPPAPVTPPQPYGGGMLASVPHAEAAAGLCRGNGSCLMKTLQDGQGIKQSRTTDVWAGASKKKKRTKKYLSMQRWIAETWDIIIAWEKGIVRSKAMIRDIISSWLWEQQSYMQGRHPIHAHFFDLKVRISPLHPTPPAHAALVLFAAGMQNVQGPPHLLWRAFHFVSSSHLYFFVAKCFSVVEILVLSWSPSLCSSFGCNHWDRLEATFLSYCISERQARLPALSSS